MRIFLDANILFFASRATGFIRTLLKMLEGQGHVLIADAYVAEEARRNLAAKCPLEALDVLDALLMRCEHGATQTRSTMAVDLGWLPEKDRPVLLAAIARHCDILVTGDKAHFGPAFGRTHGGVLICSPAQLFERL